MPRFFLQILQLYGFDILQLVVIIYLFWKLFTNHLKHVMDRIDSNINETRCVKKEVIQLKERVAHIEGQLDIAPKNSKDKS